MIDEFDRLSGQDALYDGDDLFKTIGRALLVELRERWPKPWRVLKLQAPGYALRCDLSGFRSIDVKISGTIVMVDENVARSISRKFEADLADPNMMMRLLATVRNLIDEERVFPGPKV